MFAILHALGMFVADLFKSRSRLEAENLFLRHQLTIAMRRAPPRLRVRGSDRALLIWMTRLWPNLRGMAQVVQPETILRWHRAGFKVLLRWKSRNRAGRPKIDRGLRDLIQRMSRENPLWGASRIHGELLMLGFEVAQSTVSKYMARPSKWVVSQGPLFELLRELRATDAQGILLLEAYFDRQILSPSATTCEGARMADFRHDWMRGEEPTSNARTAARSARNGERSWSL